MAVTTSRQRTIRSTRGGTAGQQNPWLSDLAAAWNTGTRDTGTPGSETRHGLAGILPRSARVTPSAGHAAVQGERRASSRASRSGRNQRQLGAPGQILRRLPEDRIEKQLGLQAPRPPRRTGATVSPSSCAAHGSARRHCHRSHHDVLVGAKRNHWSDPRIRACRARRRSPGYAFVMDGPRVRDWRDAADSVSRGSPSLTAQRRPRRGRRWRSAMPRARASAAPPRPRAGVTRAPEPRSGA